MQVNYVQCNKIIYTLYLIRSRNLETLPCLVKTTVYSWKMLRRARRGKSDLWKRTSSIRMPSHCIVFLHRIILISIVCEHNGCRLDSFLFVCFAPGFLLDFLYTGICTSMFYSNRHYLVMSAAVLGYRKSPQANWEVKC